MQTTATPGSSPAQVRQAIREGRWTKPTTGLCPGFVQANLVILPKADAFDFLLFAQRNPKPCPIIEVCEPGDPRPAGVAAGADLRFDVPKYRIYRRGQLEAEVTDIAAYWRDDLVSFLIGCSFTTEGALLNAGVRLKHLELGCNVPMFRTNMACRPAGAFQGPMVVSMRPIPRDQVVKAVQVTSRFPGAHGAPVHIGDPGAIGIADIMKPDYGDAVPVDPDEVPVFWACGVTPQAVAEAARPEFMITHSPGHMFITDVPDRDLAAIS